jgi:predicted SprT family Zn-dependent metalloprotease
MNLLVAEKLALNLMKQHNLTNIGWRFEFDNAKRRFGCCNYRAKTISLSRELVKLNDEPRVQNTILHEIAHALVGINHGHDNVWKQKAIEIGCNGNRCYSIDDTNIVLGKYKAICPKCNHVRHKHRKPKTQSSCGVCSRVFDRERLLVYNLVG